MSRISCAYIFTLARRYPRASAAAWFLLAASGLVIPALLVLIPISVNVSGSSIISLGMLLSMGILPLISTGFVAALVGPRIFALPSAKVPVAGLYGSLIALAAFVIWAILLEAAQGFISWIPRSGNSSDIPGAAIVVAYLVVLPSLVAAISAAGSISGILLHILISQGRERNNI